MEKATPEFEILGQMINRSEGPRVGGRIRSNPRNPDAGNVKSDARVKTWAIFIDYAEQGSLKVSFK